MAQLAPMLGKSAVAAAAAAAATAAAGGGGGATAAAVSTSVKQEEAEGVMLATGAWFGRPPSVLLCARIWTSFIQKTEWLLWKMRARNAFHLLVNYNHTLASAYLYMRVCVCRLQVSSWRVWARTAPPPPAAPSH